MKLILKLVQQKIDTLDEAEELSEVQQKQLAHGLKLYFGKKTSFKSAFKGECMADLWEVIDNSNPGIILYDFWQINADSGSVFYTSSVNETGVEMIQGHFDVQSSFIGKEDSIKLAEALGTAKQIKEVKSDHILNALDEIEEFKKGFILPQDPKAWLKLLKNQKVSEHFIRKNNFEFNKACWDQVCANTRLSNDFLREFSKKINWSIISQFQKLSIDFIREHKTKLDWIKISLYQEFNEDQLREFMDFLNWDFAAGKQKLSEKFMREFVNKISWDAVSWGQVLSDNFIREFHDKLNWKNMAMYQKFSEDLMREFAYKFDWTVWNCIWMHQKISAAFFSDFSSHMQWQAYSMNHTLTDDELRDYRENIAWTSLLGLGRGLSEELIKEFENYISNPPELSQHNWRTILGDAKRFPISDTYRKELKSKVV
jgi:hypothetical protein